jgi:hypothetical protein
MDIRKALLGIAKTIHSDPRSEYLSASMPSRVYVLRATSSNDFVRNLRQGYPTILLQLGLLSDRKQFGGSFTLQPHRRRVTEM